MKKHGWLLFFVALGVGYWLGMPGHAAKAQDTLTNVGKAVTSEGKK